MENSILAPSNALNSRLSRTGKFAPYLAEQGLRVRLERAPYLEVKCVRRGTPEHDLRFGEHRARAHVNGKLAGIQIERTRSCENGRGVRTRNFQGHLPMGHIHERVSVGYEGPLQVGEGQR